MHIHCHKCTKHELKECKTCGNVYCVNCGKEWITRAKWIWYPYSQYATYGTIGTITTTAENTGGTVTNEVHSHEA